MRRPVIVFAMLLLTACGPPGPPENENYDALRAARSEAYAQGDKAFYEHLLADDFVLLGANGELVDRQSYLEREFGAKRPDAVAVKLEVSDLVARRRGETLVVTYKERETTSVGGQTFNQYSRRLDVYYWQDGRWRLKAMTAAAIPDAPPVIEMDAAQLSAYAGSYAFAPGVVSTVTARNDHLAEQTTGQEPTRLMPMGQDMFFDADNVSARIEFTRDAAGKVVEQVYRAGDQIVRGRRAG